MDDRTLVDNFLGTRSEHLFRKLYHIHTPPLYRIAFRLAKGDHITAEELIQETWCVAIARLATFEWRSSLRTWLCSILMNLIREHWRHQNRNHDASGSEGIESEKNLEIDLSNAIDSLPVGYRQVLILHDIEGYKHQEIAEILGINEGTSKSQLHNARNRVRKYLQ